MVKFASKHTKPVLVICITILLLIIISITFLVFNTRNKKNIAVPKATMDDYSVITAFSDSVIIGNVQSEGAHNISKSAAVVSKKTPFELGLYKSERDALHFYNEGDFATFYMSLKDSVPVNSANPIIIEIEELHKNSYNAFGYTVSVNDTDIYFRTYEQLLTATNNYYIAVNRASIKDLSNIKVTIKSNANSEFAISKIVIYSDLYGNVEKLGFDTKMGINIFSSAANFNNIIPKYSKTYESFKMGLTSNLSFIQNNKKNMSVELDKIFSSRKDNDVPVHIMPARWWGPTSYTVDGQGGYFSDLKNNQIVYDSDSKTYVPTVPNMWSSTHWPSMNSPAVKKAGVDKINLLSPMVSDKMAIQRATFPYLSLKDVSVVMEWGAGYWGSSNGFSGGDFSTYVLQAAAKDGITLNPEDGLSDVEKQWMLKNTGRYFEEEASAYQKALSSNSILVNKGNVTYPKYQVTNNIYSHGIEESIYPTNDRKIPGWIGAVSDYNWPSAEMYEFTDKRQHDYLMTLGKLSCVNLEATMLNQASFSEYAKECYANGMEFITLFNPNNDQYPNYLAAIANVKNEELSHIRTYNRPIYNINFYESMNKNYNNNPIPNVVSKNNLTVAYDGMVKQENTAKSGEIIFKIDNNTGSTQGLQLISQAYARSGNVKFYVGSSTSNFIEQPQFVQGEKVTWFNPCSEYKIDISAFKSYKTIYVKVVLSGADVKLRTLRVEVPWSKITGQLNGEKTTYLQRRIQNINTQYRVVAERMLKQYLEKIGTANTKYENAVAMYNNAQYIEVFEYLSMAISEAIPAVFSINGFGKLGEYPINVNMPNNTGVALVKLLSISDKGCQMSFTSSKEQPITIKMGGLEQGKRYRVNRTGTNYIEVVQGDTGAELVNGVFAFDTNIVLEQSEVVTGFVEGVVVGSNETALTVEIQDPSIGYYSSGITFSYGSALEDNCGCVFERVQEGSSDVVISKPKVNDYVYLNLDSQGKIISSRAKYGNVKGVVKNYYPPDLKSENIHNGIVELDNGTLYELSFGQRLTNLNTMMASGLAKTNYLEALNTAVKVGSVVGIDYIPITYKGTNRRIISLNQNIVELLKEDFEGEWQSKAFSTNNVVIGSLDNNNPEKVAYSINTTGTLIYKIDAPSKILEAAVIYSGRTIGSSSLKFSTSIDGITWEDNAFQSANTIDSDSFRTNRISRISDAFKGKSTIYLKVEIYNNNNSTWGSLNDISLRAVLE